MGYPQKEKKTQASKLKILQVKKQFIHLNITSLLNSLNRLKKNYQIFKDDLFKKYLYFKYL
jgi:hypothetical protein